MWDVLKERAGVDPLYSLAAAPRWEEVVVTGSHVLVPTPLVPDTKGAVVHEAAHVMVEAVLRPVLRDEAGQQRRGEAASPAAAHAAVADVLLTAHDHRLKVEAHAVRPLGVGGRAVDEARDGVLGLRLPRDLQACGRPPQVRHRAVQQLLRRARLFGRGGGLGKVLVQHLKLALIFGVQHVVMAVHHDRAIGAVGSQLDELA
mmetsp:Transcript_68734/g.201250  ORF Transcript_68734/g.201250 Transcript_68734/m.201250 type:complete len:202 (-) Transcript_68734:353-958(-)